MFIFTYNITVIQKTTGNDLRIGNMTLKLSMVFKITKDFILHKSLQQLI